MPKRIPTPAQQAASRRNGALARGPRTLAASLLANRTTAKTVCLPAEDHEAFHALLISFQQHFKPRTDIEFLRVETLASLEWRLRRLWDSERSILALQMQKQASQNPGQPPAALLGDAQRTLADSSRAIDKLQIQEGRLIRAYDRTLAQLHSLRKNRAFEPENPLNRKPRVRSGPPAPEPFHPGPEPEVIP